MYLLILYSIGICVCVFCSHLVELKTFRIALKHYLDDRIYYLTFHFQLFPEMCQSSLHAMWPRFTWAVFYMYIGFHRVHIYHPPGTQVKCCIKLNAYTEMGVCTKRDSRSVLVSGWKMVYYSLQIKYYLPLYNVILSLQMKLQPKEKNSTNCSQYLKVFCIVSLMCVNNAKAFNGVFIKISFVNGTLTRR